MKDGMDVSSEDPASRWANLQAYEVLSEVDLAFCPRHCELASETDFLCRESYSAHARAESDPKSGKKSEICITNEIPTREKNNFSRLESKASAMSY